MTFNRTQSNHQFFNITFLPDLYFVDILSFEMKMAADASAENGMSYDDVWDFSQNNKNRKIIDVGTPLKCGSIGVT